MLTPPLAASPRARIPAVTSARARAIGMRDPGESHAPQVSRARRQTSLRAPFHRTRPPSNRVILGCRDARASSPRAHVKRAILRVACAATLEFPDSRRRLSRHLATNAPSLAPDLCAARRAPPDASLACRNAARRAPQDMRRSEAAVLALAARPPRMTHPPARASPTLRSSQLPPSVGRLAPLRARPTRASRGRARTRKCSGEFLESARSARSRGGRRAHRELRRLGPAGL
ncbi:hypothetical protein B0H15DRAFT_844146 [Mycena belliarum]|uniref:Uncharacterized protein n=1 Tax=Mycena belliarum TaxID=1033014 RepID=A0AAD6U1K0_9AGAR|nr:hypothetical protein B0H15DRAFT_844146 [Mycena belliae]